MLMTTQKIITTTRNEDALGDQLYSICNLEGITLIWYDENMNVTTREELKITKKHLRQINNFVIFEKEEKSCIDTIESNKNEKILLVISGSVADHILSLDDKSIHKLVHSVFIFCHEKDNYQTLLEKHSKINGIFTDAEELKTAIKIEVDLIQRHFETFNIYDRNEQKAMYDLSQQQAPFIWLSVFKEIVIQMPKDTKAKNEMIDTCTKYYHGNKSKLKQIDDFNRDYKPEDAIRWYTKTSFVYRLVNKALRTGDIEQLYVFRFYISDLCEEIDKRHKQITDQRSWLFYRGVRLPLEEVEKVKQSEGKLISINGFLSTSLSKDVAVEFALMKTDKDTEESVVFEIECNNESATFALIEKDSDHPEEKEVLFDLSTTFEVLSVSNDEKKEANINIWIVKLRSTQEGKKMGKEFVESFTKALEDGDRLYVEIFWGDLLCKMGEFEKSLRYFHKLLIARPPNVPVEFIHWEMTSPLVSLGRLDEALEHIELSRKKCQKPYIGLTNFYGLLGFVYRKKGQYSRAAEECQKALQVCTVQFGEYHCQTAESHHCLGLTYFYLGQHQLALNNLNKAVEIYEKYYPERDYPLSVIFSTIGNVYKTKGDRDRAVEYYQKAVDICLKISTIHLPIIFNVGSFFYKIGLIACSLNMIDLSFQYFTYAMERKYTTCQGIHVSKNIIECFSAIGKILIVKGDFKTSLELIENALSQALQLYGVNHVEVADLYYDQGIALECLRRNDEALVAFQAALDIQKKLFPEGHRHLAFSLSSTGNQYRIKQELSLAKKYCDEALEMQKRILPPDDFDICLPLYHIGLILYDQEEYKKSLLYLWKALKAAKSYMEKMSFILLASILTAIGDINIRLENVDFALQRFKDALSSYETFFSPEHPMILELRNKIEALEEKSKAL